MSEFNNVAIVKKANVYFGDNVSIDVLLPGTEQWQSVTGGESFDVPANAAFTLKIDTPTDYCCSFIK